MIDALKNNSMMVHLSEALARKEDIGHYGRLVFTMVARHFVSEDELAQMLANDHDFSLEQARELVTQVVQAGYNPPKRDKILEYQGKQEFPIIPNPEDPDAGNVYKDLEFPDGVYKHIEEYRDAKAHAGA